MDDSWSNRFRYYQVDELGFFAITKLILIFTLFMKSAAYWLQFIGSSSGFTSACLANIWSRIYFRFLPM